MRPIYLDNNATTRVDPAVVAAMLPYFMENFGNPSSAHAFGAPGRKGMKTARDRVAALVGADYPDQILFTSGGTESDNAAIRAGLAANPDRNEVVVSAVEHPAVLTLVRRLDAEGRIKAHVIPVLACGCLDRERYRAALSPRVALVSVMWANNETGVIFPVEALAEEAKAVGAVFHTDAVQAAGRAPVNLKRSAIDLLSLSAHKLHGPKGVGALYVRRGLKFAPMISRRTSGARAPRRHRERPWDRRFRQGGRDRRRTPAWRHRADARVARPARKRPRGRHPRHRCHGSEGGASAKHQRDRLRRRGS